MNPWKVTSMMKIVLLLVSVFFQQTMAFSLGKELLIATVLTQILKPRWVPIPIPIPFHLKFVKHTKKPFPVPIYSHSLSAHQVETPLSYGMNNVHGYESYGHSDLSTLADYSSLHELPPMPHNIQSIMNDLEEQSKFMHGSSSNQVDNVHADIEAIGGLDMLTYLERLGDKEKWWKD